MTKVNAVAHPPHAKQLRATVLLASVLFSTPFLLVSGAGAQTGSLLAINEGESTLSIINPKTGLEIARVAEGVVAGHEVVASFDGKTAYVPIYGDSSAGDPGSDGSELVAIDLVSHKVVGHVDFGHGVRPHQPTLDQHDGMLYVTTELDQTITVIDPKTMKIIGVIPTTQQTLSNSSRRPGKESVLVTCTQPSDAD